MHARTHMHTLPDLSALPPTGCTPPSPGSAAGAGGRFIVAHALLLPPRHKLIPHEASLYGVVSSALLTWEATYF